MAQQSPSNRKQCDFTKLIMAGYELELNDGSTQDFTVLFHGPKNTSYEGGIWKVQVSLPDDYPFASPSIGFLNKVLHPNVDEASGSVCLDVINQTWTPLYSLVNIFEVFLPQLLTYPNPTDPLNTDAASLLIKDKNLYEQRITEYVQRYASPQAWKEIKTGQPLNIHSSLSINETKFTTVSNKQGRNVSDASTARTNSIISEMRNSNCDSYREELNEFEGIDIEDL